MESLQYILQSPIIQKLGWTLVHFVWQAAAIAAILAIVLKILQKHSSNLRYTIACLALVLVVPIQVITLRNIEVAVPAFDPVKLASHDLPQSPALVVTEMLPLGSSPLPPQNVVMPTVPLKDRLIGAVEPALPYVVVIWLVGVFSLSLWHLGGWTQLQKLRRQMVKDVTPTIRSKSQHLAGLMGIRKAISLMESALVQVPTVIGHFKPIILLPATALTGLSSEQIEAILAHELAHIKRNDYFFNILLTVVEILGFYHPAVWWISHKIRVERENCCDDLAIDMVQNRKEYASALFTMEQIRAKQPNLALSANGGHLFERIRRLLAKDSSHARFNGWAVASAIVLVMIALAIPVAFAISGEDAASFDSDNDANITAAELVRHVRASENWIHNVDTLYLRINRTFSALTGDALAQAQKRYETEMKQRRAGMIPSPPSTTDTSDMVEIALGDNRLRYLTKRDTSTQIKIWDGKQVSTYGEYADFDQKHYALRDELQESFQHLMQDMNWLRCQPHVFWWKNRTLPMDYYGSPDEFEIIGEENYRGTDCYVLEYLPEGDAQKAGLSWKWYVGKKDRLLRAITSFRNGKPAIQHWTLNYKQVAPGCVMPMTQGHHFYKWNEDGTSYYIAGPINLKLTEVRVNQKLDDSLFEMEFTDGITVQDDRQGVFISYPYDSKVANMSMPQRARAASKLRLKNIGKGLYDYALDYDDNYPPTLDWLAERNYIETWHIIGKGPKPKRFAGPDYIYITGLSGWSSPNNIIVYENTEYLRRNTDKVNIISCDGHIESVTPDELIRQLQATYKRLGKDVSKIDKLRWADTVNDPDPKQPLQQSGANTAILLPDIRKVLNLSTGRIIDVPFSNKMPDEWLKYVQQNVNCGIIFDHDGELSHLGFINISSVSRPTTKKNGIEMMSFVSKNLPQQITVTAKDNKQYTVKILNAKNQGCTLQYKQIADAKDQAADTSGDTSKSKSIEHVNMLRSATNMKYIGRALHVYAFDYDDKFPPALNELVPTTDIHPKTFKSPRQPHGFDGPGYIYISGQTANDSPNNVIVYENTKCLPKATGKVNVLFRDGHIQAVKPDELIEFLRETYKNLGKNVSDIEKLIWADTVDARFGGTGGFGGMARPDDDMNMGIKFANSKPNQIVAAENLYSFSDAMQTAEIVGQMLNGAWKSMAELKISYKKKDWGAVEENSIQVRDVFRRLVAAIEVNEQAAVPLKYIDGIEFTKEQGELVELFNIKMLLSNIEEGEKGLIYDIADYSDELHDAVRDKEMNVVPEYYNRLVQQWGHFRDIKMIKELISKTAVQVEVEKQDTAPVPNIDLISQTEKQAELNERPQVMIHARIGLIDKNLLEELGFTTKEETKAALENNKQNKLLPFCNSILDENQAETLIKALKFGTNSKLISSPTVLTDNREQAVIEVINERNYIADYSEPANLEQAPKPIVDTLKTGVIMSATPMITSDNKHVVLRVNLEYSNVTNSTFQNYQQAKYKDRYTYELPTTETIDLRTRVTVPDQSTIILGGVPANYTNPDDERQLLIILIKPTIIMPDQQDI